MRHARKPGSARSLLVVLFAAQLVSVGRPGHAQLSSDIAAYRLRIEGYRAGGKPAERDVLQLIPDPSIAARVVDGDAGWSSLELAAAAMLHTDVALGLVRTGRQSDAVAHIEAATTLLRAAVVRDAGLTEFAGRWRETVAGLFSAFEAPGIASSLSLDSMKWLRPSDERVRAIAAYEKGVTTEIQAAVAGPLSGPQPKRTPVIPPAARSDLRSAAKQFEAALAADPAFAEAALHLGRVTLLDGRDADAERWLGIASEAQSSSTRYLAQMFLGATAERQARYDEAIKRYQAAHTAFRWGQAAPLALSHVLMRAGREREARDALDAHFTAPSGRVVEPLWTYLSDSSTDLGPMLDLLRAEVWR